MFNFDSTQPSYQYGFNHNDNQFSPKWNAGPIQKPLAHHYDAHFRQQQANVAPMQVPTTYHHSRSTKSVHAQQSNALKRSPLSHHNERSNENWQHGRPKHNNVSAIAILGNAQFFYIHNRIECLVNCVSYIFSVDKPMFFLSIVPKFFDDVQKIIHFKLVSCISKIISSFFFFFSFILLVCCIFFFHISVFTL